MPSAVLRAAIAVVTLNLGGCVAAGLEVASAGVGGAVDAGLGEVRNGAVLRTFTAPIGDVHAATVAALDAMALELTEDNETPEGRKLVARTERHGIEIELARLSPNATRLRVLADAAGLFKKDAATGHEIVHQAALALRAAQARAASGMARAP